MGFPTRRRGVKDMFSKVVTSGVVAICVLAAPAAFADQGRSDLGEDDDVRVGPTYDYAQSHLVDPIVRQVRVETPRRECWTDDSLRSPHGSVRETRCGRTHDPRRPHRCSDRQSIWPRDGRRAATVAGALIGTAIGHDAGSRPYDRYGSRPTTATAHVATIPARSNVVMFAMSQRMRTGSMATT